MLAECKVVRAAVSSSRDDRTVPPTGRFRTFRLALMTECLSVAELNASGPLRRRVGQQAGRHIGIGMVRACSLRIWRLRVLLPPQRRADAQLGSAGPPVLSVHGTGPPSAAASALTACPRFRHRWQTAAPGDGLGIDCGWIYLGSARVGLCQRY